MQPTAQKMQLPRGYGRTTTTLRWPSVRERLEVAKAYWLATTRPDGRPHVVPLDGVWVDDVWFYGGSPDTVHRQVVAENPLAVMHLPDPHQAVIVEGKVRRADPSAELAQRLADVSNTKYAEYGYQNDASAYTDAIGLFPSRVIAWSSFPKDATRFLFGP